jgi:hypothetical protein
MVGKSAVFSVDGRLGAGHHLNKFSSSEEFFGDALSESPDETKSPEAGRGDGDAFRAAGGGATGEGFGADAGA